MNHVAWLILTVCLLGVASAADPFEKRTYEYGGKKLLYRMLSPEKIEPGKKYPLVVFLHGAGERGNNNEAQLKHCARKFAEPAIRKKHSCFVIAPQCPRGRRWVEVNWGERKPHTTPETPSEPMGLLLNLLKESMKKLPIDTDRVYASGLSMGGFGAWDLLVRRPNVFAAAIPVCGGADNSKAKTIAHIPIWVWHGGADRVVHTVRSQTMVEALKKAGGKPKYTEIPGCGHGSWGPAYKEPTLLDWLFSHRRKTR